MGTGRVAVNPRARARETALKGRLATFDPLDLSPAQAARTLLRKPFTSRVSTDELRASSPAAERT